MKLILFTFILIFVSSCSNNGSADGKTTAQPEPKPVVFGDPTKDVEILEAKINRNNPKYHTINKPIITGASNLTVKKITVHSIVKSRYGMTLYTEDFPGEQWLSLIVRVKDKYFIPISAGGMGGGIYCCLELKDVDQVTAEFLNGGVFSKAPKKSFEVKYMYLGESPDKDAVNVLIDLINVSEDPYTIHYGTSGGSNYPCRDTHLSFSATLNGKTVPLNPKPLPDGFLSSPFVSKPNSRLRRTEDLRQWLKFDKPGEYVVNAVYNVKIANPDKNAAVKEWSVDYTDQFTILIKE